MGVYELPNLIVVVTELCEGGCLLDTLELVETMTVRGMCDGRVLGMGRVREGCVLGMGRV